MFLSFLFLSLYRRSTHASALTPRSSTRRATHTAQRDARGHTTRQDTRVVTRTHSGRKPIKQIPETVLCPDEPRECSGRWPHPCCGAHVTECRRAPNKVASCLALPPAHCHTPSRMHLRVRNRHSRRASPRRWSPRSRSLPVRPGCGPAPLPALLGVAATPTPMCVRARPRARAPYMAAALWAVRAPSSRPRPPPASLPSSSFCARTSPCMSTPTINALGLTLALGGGLWGAPADQSSLPSGGGASGGGGASLWHSRCGGGRRSLRRLTAHTTSVRAVLALGACQA